MTPKHLKVDFADEMTPLTESTSVCCCSSSDDTASEYSNNITTTGVATSTGNNNDNNNNKNYYNSTTTSTKNDIETVVDHDIVSGGTMNQYLDSMHSLRLSLVKASSRLGDMISYHTGSIGMLGSVSIAVNSLTGPAMLNLPATFARCGLIPTMTVLIFVCIVSALCSLHMASVISKVPGNINFKKEIEYSQAFQVFWGDQWFTITQALFLCCITCLNISSIVDVSQIVDTFLGHWLPNGGTSALLLNFDRSNTTNDFDNDNNTYYYEYYPTIPTVQWIRWDYSGCTEEIKLLGLCTPFQDADGILITAGKILTTIAFLPLALMDLKENSYWQVLGFLILLITCVHFSITFATYPGKNYNNLTLWGTDWSDLFGVVLFNFSLVIAIPAWLYEREPHVHIPTVVYGSSILTVCMYAAIGILGCIAMPNVADNMLQSMMAGSFGLLMQLSASLFAFGIVGLGIPLFSVLARLNLTSSGVCSMKVGHILSVFFPFSVAFFMYDGTSVTTLLSWGGVIFTGLVAFILPLLLALHVINEYDNEGTILVYGYQLNNKTNQKNLLRILFILTAGSVLCAFVGNFYSTVQS